MRSVLITGTSSGIGLATAVVLASRGWRVFATMRNLKKRGLLDESLRTAGVQDKVCVECIDVTSQASIQAAADSILARTGNALDAVVHNAGVAAAGALEDIPDSELRRVMETNFATQVQRNTHLIERYLDPVRMNLDSCDHSAEDYTQMLRIQLTPRVRKPPCLIQEALLDMAFNSPH